MNKELTATQSVITALTTYTGTLISGEGFQQLSDIIDKISNNKEELTDGMRHAATQYVNEWDSLVVARLNDRVYQLNRLTDFFNNKRPDFYAIYKYCDDKSVDSMLMISVISMLRSGDNKSWHKFADQLEGIINSVEELEDNQEDAPKREDYFDESERNMGYDDRIIAQKKYELDFAKYNKDHAKKEFKVRTAFVKILNDMLQDPDIKNMINVIKEQKRKAKNAQSLVHEKTSLVKLAINFSGTELLKALQELHEFQQKL